jgi:hypothetical protein
MKSFHQNIFKLSLRLTFCISVCVLQCCLIASCTLSQKIPESSNQNYNLKIQSQKIEEGKIEISKFAQAQCSKQNKSAQILDSNFIITPLENDKTNLDCPANKPHHLTKAAKSIRVLKNVYGGRKNLENHPCENLKTYQIELTFKCQ